MKKISLALVGLITVCHEGMRYSTTTVGAGQSEARAVSVVADPACKE